MFYNNTEHNNDLPLMLIGIILSVTFYFLFCWVSLCWVSLCWVSLCWVSLCWVSLCWVSLCWVSLCWVPWHHFILLQTNTLAYLSHSAQEKPNFVVKFFMPVTNTLAYFVPAFSEKGKKSFQHWLSLSILRLLFL
jgi:hypothetical protein